MNKKSKKNLPLYGIGPVIVFGQLLIAGGAIAISYKFKWDCYEIISGPRTTGDGYYESCIVAVEDNHMEVGWRSGLGWGVFLVEKRRCIW